jgi:hypothetical protein
MITGVEMESRVMVNPKAIDDFYAILQNLITGLPQAFIVSTHESI